MYTNYEEMGDNLSFRRDINGNSVSAQISGEDYIVKSYNTEILRVEDSTGEVKYFDNGRISVTTSRLQNMIIDVYELNNGKKTRS